MDCLAEISKIIDCHRADAVITCEETCWCWDVEAAICNHSKSVKEHSVAADAEGRCKKCDWWNDKGFETCHDCGNEFPHR